jgi:hypothetical protein
MCTCRGKGDTLVNNDKIKKLRIKKIKAFRDRKLITIVLMELPARK